MTTALVVSAVWLSLSLAVGLLVGLTIRRRDRQVPWSACACRAVAAGAAMRDMTAIDASKCAFVCYADLTGMVHMHSEAGYTNRQIGQMLRVIADTCDAKADAKGEPALDPADLAHVKGGAQ